MTKLSTASLVGMTMATLSIYTPQVAAQTTHTVPHATTTPHTPPTLGLTSLGITISNTPGNPRDWVGVFPHGADNNSFIDWVYVACDAKTCKGNKPPSSTTTVHLNIPSTLGQADVRLLSLDSTGNFQVVTEIDPDLSAHGDVRLP